MTRICLEVLSMLFATMIMTMRSSCAAAFTTVTARHQNRALASAIRRFASVTGPVYDSEDENAPIIRLFTKEGCTLCDKVKDVLSDLREELPHALNAVDITDNEHEIWHEKYKYDIPVLHVGDQYWTKHRITEEEARTGLTEAIARSFVSNKGEPDAGEMERRQAARQKNE